MKKIILISLITVIIGASTANLAQAQSDHPRFPPYRDAINRFRKNKKEILGLKNNRIPKNLPDIADVFIQRNRAVKDRVSKNNDIYKGFSPLINEEINNDTENLEKIKSRILDAKNPEELKNIIEELKKNERPLRTRKLVLTSHIDKLENIIKKAEEISSQTGSKITELKNSGKDVSKLETLLSDANNKIKSVKDQISSLKTKLTDQNSNNEEKNAEIKSIFDSINKEIRAAYDIFRQIISEGKSLGLSILPKNL